MTRPTQSPPSDVVLLGKVILVDCGLEFNVEEDSEIVFEVMINVLDELVDGLVEVVMIVDMLVYVLTVSFARTLLWYLLYPLACACTTTARAKSSSGCMLNIIHCYIVSISK